MISLLGELTLYGDSNGSNSWWKSSVHWPRVGWVLENERSQVPEEDHGREDWIWVFRDCDPLRILKFVAKVKNENPHVLPQPMSEQESGEIPCCSWRWVRMSKMRWRPKRHYGTKVKVTSYRTLQWGHWVHSDLKQEMTGWPPRKTELRYFTSSRIFLSVTGISQGEKQGWSWTLKHAHSVPRILLTNYRNLKIF